MPLNWFSQMSTTVKDVIKEAMWFLGGEATVKQVKGFIASNYGSRWKDVETSMADLTYPGSRSSQYSEKDRFLERTGRGKYRLRVHAVIPKEVIFLWRRRTVSDVYGELLGVFTEAGLAFERIRGEKGIDYHVESWPLNKINPSDSEKCIWLGREKNGIIV